MTAKTIAIIGAGIGGLSAGVYAQMNGYKVQILEMHARPGGVCTAWTRHGYTFDGCIHNLAGSHPVSVLHEMWRELGVVPAISMKAYEELVSVEVAGTKPFTVHCQLDRLQTEMKALAPEDAVVIDEFIAAAKRFRTFDLLSLARAGIFERLKALAMAPALMKFGGQTLEQFAQRFKNPLLRKAFPTLVYDWPNSPVAILLSFLGRMDAGDFGWAVGGSGVFAEAIERRFRALGGEIRYHAHVASILIENNRAVGVKLTDGSEVRADTIVSNANGFGTIYGMLGGRYTNRAIDAYYARPEDRIEMGIHVSLGLNRDLSREPHAIVLELDKPVAIAGEDRRRLYVETFGFDETLAPPGKGVLKVVMATSYRKWDELARDPATYHSEKQQIADTIIGLLEQRFLGLKAQVEAVDVATPATTRRFTGNGQGYRAGVMDMARALFTGWRLSQTLPGLKNFYMVGQWAGPPGVSLVAAMGRDVARSICRRDGRTFTATTSAPALNKTRQIDLAQTGGAAVATFSASSSSTSH